MFLCCFVQVMFRYLCEEAVHVFSEKQFHPTVRNLATNLILSGTTESTSDLSSHLQLFISALTSVVVCAFQVSFTPTRPCRQTCRKTSCRLCGGWRR